MDCFSKWVEVGKLPSKHSWRTAEWIMNEIVCRWGKPDMIRSDNGAEWMGDFREFLAGLDITVRPITVGNSAANGQAERMIRTFKDIVRREGVLEDGYWSDALPMVLAALRMTSSASHGFPPFTIITGQYPSLPSQLLDKELHVDWPEPSEAEQVAFTEAVVATTRKLWREAKLRLAKRDADARRRIIRTEKAYHHIATMFDF